jgi:hypothetical protein
LKFVIIYEESLKSYVTSKKQKSDSDFTLMSQYHIFIEDIIPKKETTNEEKDDKESKNKDKEIIGEFMDEIGKNEQYDFIVDNSQNPFKNVLIGTSIGTGVGAVATGGTITLGLAINAGLVTLGEAGLFAGGVTLMGGMAVTGIGLALAVPSLLGFGAYKIYKNIKDKKKGIF